MATTATANTPASPAPTSTPRLPSTPSKPVSRDQSQSASLQPQPPPPPPPAPQSQLSFPSPEAEYEFLGTVEGEIAFFRSTMRARPVGKHRHFHMLAIRNAIYHATGRVLRIESIWKKLRDCWDLDALDAIDIEAESYVAPRRTSSKPTSIRSPSPSENLAAHPFFREEFMLPYDDTIQSLLDARRLRDSISVASSPAARTPTPAPPVQKKRPGPTRGRKRKSKADLAGLVGGDSDSSALTQDSADEGGVGAGVERDSVATGTDGGTETGEEEDAEMRGPSPELVEEPPSEQPMPRRRGRPPKNRGRGRGATPATSTRGTKKRKRG